MRDHQQVGDRPKGEVTARAMLPRQPSVTGIRRRPPPLLGRRAECHALDALLQDAIAGRSRVLVLRGEPGSGKSALLAHAAERIASDPADWRIVSAAGVEAEMELPYGALRQLCGPLLEQAHQLPTPQRAALETALGRAGGPAPDRFLVGLAVLTLIAAATEHRPLACLVDDGQWLDVASSQVLAFVARRLLAERLALVCASRPGVDDDLLPGQPVLEIRGLSRRDARRLLVRHLGGTFDPAVLEEIVGESRGNPLALLELPRTRAVSHLAGGFGVLPATGPASRIEHSYLQRLDRLPADTRLLVLAAAAEPVGDVTLFHRAAALLDVESARLAPAADAGLLQVRGRVEFAHPVVRSAVYRAADPCDRRRVHRALAAATDPVQDPDRRAWHRARASGGADEEVAAELERSAGRARARAGVAAAAAFLTRASELTPRPRDRASRALAAAAVNVQAGVFDVARTMLALAEDGPIDDMQRAKLDLVGAQLAFAMSRGNEAVPQLLAAARRLEPLDPELARETYLDALTSALFVVRAGDRAGLDDVLSAARAAPVSAGREPGAGDLLLDALVALLLEDDATALPLGRAALRKLTDDAESNATKARWLRLGAAIAADLWDDANWYRLSRRYLGLTRRAGSLRELPHAVDAHATVLLFRGELAAAAVLVEEGLSLQQASGITTASHASLALAAWQGREGPARTMLERSPREPAGRGQGRAVAFGGYAHALLCNGLGQHEEALVAAGRARDHCGHRAGLHLFLPELVEAAAATGRPDGATDALAELSRKARASGTSWALGIEARTRALLSEGDQTEHLFRAAIEHLGRARVRAELARAHLLYGTWLRGAGRPVAARSELEAALHMFDGMGIQGFAARARRELRMAGGDLPGSQVDGRDELSEHEARIARLARDGLSNQEIAAQLFISPRTVEWHLRKVFTKLGISSRDALRRALPARHGTTASTTSPSTPAHH